MGHRTGRLLETSAAPPRSSWRDGRCLRRAPRSMPQASALLRLRAEASGTCLRHRPPPQDRLSCNSPPHASARSRNMFVVLMCVSIVGSRCAAFVVQASHRCCRSQQTDCTALAQLSWPSLCGQFLRGSGMVVGAYPGHVWGVSPSSVGLFCGWPYRRTCFPRGRIEPLFRRACVHRFPLAPLPGFREPRRAPLMALRRRHRRKTFS